MAGPALKGKRIAILATDGVEQIELTAPRKALDDAGATTVLVSPMEGRITALNHERRGDEIPVDLILSGAHVDDFDGLMLPGGVVNSDNLRTVPAAVNFVRDFFEAGKPISAICHAPWLLIEAGAVNGRTLTSFPSLKTDLKNAGADWVDRDVVTDEGIVTSRKPDDIPQFNKKMIEEFAEGIHKGARKSTRVRETTSEQIQAR